MILMNETSWEASLNKLTPLRQSIWDRTGVFYDRVEKQYPDPDDMPHVLTMMLGTCASEMVAAQRFFMAFELFKGSNRVLEATESLASSLKFSERAILTINRVESFLNSYWV